MKKTMKKLSCIALMAVMLLALSVTAFADGRVTYDGSAGSSSLPPAASILPPTCLRISRMSCPVTPSPKRSPLTTRWKKNVKIKVYMRALGAVEGSEEFLSQMNLTVKLDGNSKAVCRLPPMRPRS